MMRLLYKGRIITLYYSIYDHKKFESIEKYKIFFYQY